MRIEINKSFKNDIQEFKFDKTTMEKIAVIIEDIKNYSKISEITNCKKMKNSKNCYRIRVGDYRMGFKFENGIIKFIVFKHRSIIYKYFP